MEAFGYSLSQQHKWHWLSSADDELGTLPLVRSGFRATDPETKQLLDNELRKWNGAAWERVNILEYDTTLGVWTYP